MIVSLGGSGGVVSTNGGKVDSVVVDVDDVLSNCSLVLLGRPMPAPRTVPVSFAAVDFRFLASIGDSDLLKAPAVHNENVLNRSTIHLLSLFILHAARIPKIITAATSPMQIIQHSLFLCDLARLSFVTYNFSPLQETRKSYRNVMRHGR